jgi:hypothetical protein
MGWSLHTREVNKTIKEKNKYDQMLQFGFSTNTHHSQSLSWTKQETKRACRPLLGCGWAGPGWRCAWVGSGARPCPAPSGCAVCALLPGPRRRCVTPCSCAPRRVGVGRAWRIRCISCLSARRTMRCAARLGCCRRSRGQCPTRRRVCVTCLHTHRRCSLRAWCMPCVLVARMGVAGLRPSRLSL